MWVGAVLAPQDGRGRPASPLPLTQRPAQDPWVSPGTLPADSSERPGSDRLGGRGGQPRLPDHSAWKLLEPSCHQGTMLQGGLWGTGDPALGELTGPW